MHTALDKDTSIIFFHASSVSRKGEIITAIRKTCTRLTESATFLLEKGEESKAIHFAEFAARSAQLLRMEYKSSSLIQEIQCFWETFEIKHPDLIITKDALEFIRRLRYGEIKPLSVPHGLNPNTIPKSDVWALYLQSQE